MGRIHNPPHPGESIREDILPALDLSVTEAAKQLGVARVTLSRLINGQSGISADMARRLEAWLGGPKRGPSAECRELGKNAGGLRSLAGHAATCSQGRQGTDGGALSVCGCGWLARISIAVTSA